MPGTIWVLVNTRMEVIVVVVKIKKHYHYLKSKEEKVQSACEEGSAGLVAGQDSEQEKWKRVGEKEGL